MRLLQEEIAALRNAPDPTGPATPVFFMDKPQTLTLQKPDSDSPGIRKRHHTRLWATQFCAGGPYRPLWVVTASIDVGMEFSPRTHLPTHRIDPAIDPAIDNERALTSENLQVIGVRLQSVITVAYLD